MAILEHRADPHREWLATGVALAKAGPRGLALQRADPLALAAERADRTIGPQMRLDEREGGFFVVEMRGVERIGLTMAWFSAATNLHPSG